MRGPLPPRYTHHTFRHVFVTRVLEATNCDDFTVSHWIGHKDGGKLLAKKYAHLNQNDSQEQIKKLSFSFAPEAEQPPTIVLNGVTYTTEQLAALVAQQGKPAQQAENIIPLAKVV